jgi:hypothetical protein
LREDVDVTEGADGVIDDEDKAVLFRLEREEGVKSVSIRAESDEDRRYWVV